MPRAAIPSERFGVYAPQVSARSCESPGENRRVLDLGAGNGWLAYQLSRRGHSVVAVDWSDDEFDGLGALCHYAATLAACHADFAALPFADAQFDLIVFNAALHYARNLADTFAESLRVLLQLALWS